MDFYVFVMSQFGPARQNTNFKCYTFIRSGRFACILQLLLFLLKAFEQYQATHYITDKHIRIISTYMTVVTLFARGLCKKKKKIIYIAVRDVVLISSGWVVSGIKV